MKQHAVSRFYLYLFTPDSGQRVLWEYSKKRPGPKQKSPKNATSESRLYSVRRPDGSWDNSVESQLQRIESAAATPLKNLAAGRSVDGADRATIALFIGLMFLRVEGYGDHAARQAKMMESPEATIKFLENHSALGKILPTQLLDAFKKHVTERGYGVKLPPNYHLALLFKRASRYADVIRRMSWSVYQTSRPKFFVTSDNPAFARRSASPLDPGLVGLGRADLGVELGLPLSHKAFLVASWGNVPAGTLLAPPNKVTELNTRTVLSAPTHVFAPQESREIESLVRQHENFRLAYPKFEV